MTAFHIGRKKWRALCGAELCLAALCGIALNGCTQHAVKKPPPARLILTSPQGYSLVLARGWRPLMAGAMHTDIIAQSPVVHGFAANFNVTVQPAPNTTLQDVRAALPQYAQAFPGFRALGSGATKVGGLPAVAHGGSYSRLKQPTRLWQAIVLRNGKAFAFSATCAARDAARWKPDIDAMLQSVRWLKPSSAPTPRAKP